MRILIVSSEVVPFAKTGGLADVAGALPLALAELGHDVRVAMPKYAAVDDEHYHLIPILEEIVVKLGDGIAYTTQVKRTVFPHSEVPVYFIQNHQLFGRPGLYQENGVDYPDNALRFAVFCKAVIWLMLALDWVPDIIHCNDWQTALIPVYLRTDPEVTANSQLSAPRILYTIHNLAYQGLFEPEFVEKLGIQPSLFHPSGLEFYGKLNLMKGGILFADEISTVSRRYAEEIQTPEYGCGLEGLLRQRSEHLHGIMNGIDERVWNPETDLLLPFRYSFRSIGGKTRCKKALQAELGLPVDANVPLLGMISRLDRQKGFDLLAEVLDQLMENDLQFVLLGTGAPEYHQLFEKAAQRWPQKMSVNLRFDNTLAHRIEAGADIFLMPSRFEPCGLNQLYSMKYGTPPVVRETGGLADSVVDATPENLERGIATGFVFRPYESAAMMEAITRSLALYRKKPLWRKLQKAGMEKDFSWRASAKLYVELFERMLSGNNPSHSMA